MSAGIRGAYPDAEVELVKGSRGVFTVDLDGDRIWDKRKHGGFPPTQTILDKIAAR